MKIYIKLSNEQLEHIKSHMRMFTGSSDFGDLWNDGTVEKTDGEYTVKKRFCAFVDLLGEVKLFNISTETAHFLVALIDSVHGGDNMYDADTDTVFNTCGQPVKHRSLQKFLDDSL